MINSLAFVRLAPLALALAFFGCGSAPLSDSHVGREELYRSGNFDYDEFFEDVNGLQVGAKNAEADERGARAPLGHALGVGETSLDRLLDTLRSKAEELSLSKSRVRFAMEGTDDDGRPLAGKMISVGAKSAAQRAVPKEATKLAVAIRESAQGEGQVWEKYGPLPEKGRRLAARAAELRDSLDRDFTGASKAKRAQVERELEMAQTVSGQIADTCDKVVVSATRFLKEGRDILVASANVEPPKPAPKNPGKSKPIRLSKPKEPPPRSEPGSPAPEAAGADFNP
jgi:hypothetical protein